MRLIFVLLAAITLSSCATVSSKLYPVVAAYCVSGEAKRVLIREVVAGEIAPHRVEIQCN